MVKIIIDENVARETGDIDVMVELHASEKFIMTTLPDAVYKVLNSVAEHTDRTVMQCISLFHGGLLFEHTTKGGNLTDN